MLVYLELSWMISCAETSYSAWSVVCGRHAPMLSSKGAGVLTALANFSQGGHACLRVPRRHFCAAERRGMDMMASPRTKDGAALLASIGINPMKKNPRPPSQEQEAATKEQADLRKRARGAEQAVMAAGNELAASEPTPAEPGSAWRLIKSAADAICGHLNSHPSETNSRGRMVQNVTDVQSRGCNTLRQNAKSTATKTCKLGIGGILPGT